MTDESRLLCVCQGEDDGIMSILFYYGLEGMGQETPYKIRTPAIGTISDTFEDIKEKLAKVAKKVEKRQKKSKKKTNENIEPESSNLTGAENLLYATTNENQTINERDIMVEFLDTKATDNSSEDCESKTSDNKQKSFNISNDHEASNVSNFKSNNDSDMDRMIIMDIAQDRNIICPETNNEDAWKTDHIFTLNICNLIVKYKIYYNPPTVKPLELPNSMLNGYMIYPRAEFLNCSKDTCRFEWYKCKEKPKRKLNVSYKKIFFQDIDKIENISKSSEKTAAVTNPNVTVNMHSDDHNQELLVVKKYEDNPSWTLINTDFVFIPSEEDVGYYIRLVCKPHGVEQYGIEYSAESKSPVRNGPGICPYDKRHAYTKEWCNKDSFRVLGCNILADKYANTKSSLDMYYPYCPPYALSLDYRKQHIIKEILGYKADILCLQEVDQKVFHSDLIPILNMHGYEGFLTTKYKTVSQGVSVFFKTEKFRHVASFNKEVRTALFEDHLHRDLFEKVSKNVIFMDQVSERKAILMVQVLESVEQPNKLLLVANTHLTCGQKIAHIRAIQLATALQHIEWLLTTYYQNKDISVIFCGDLNSLPESAVVQLLSKSKVSAKHADWFIKGRPEYVGDMDLTTSLKLQTAHPDIKYTNYVSGFYGIIDYIFYDRNKLDCTSTVPMPSHDDIVEDTACPNAKFPSDHLALICDLKWK